VWCIRRHDSVSAHMEGEARTAPVHQRPHPGAHKNTGVLPPTRRPPELLNPCRAVSFAYTRSPVRSTSNARRPVHRALQCDQKGSIREQRTSRRVASLG
jgi:hypothetical protein